jgi:hypothetical protein
MRILFIESETTLRGMANRFIVKGGNLVCYMSEQHIWIKNGLFKRGEVPK